MRRHYGFGYVERKHQVREPRAAAAYLSSYFISGKGKKISLEESVQSNWLPRSIIHVSTELTKHSGITMRTLRLRRYAWVVWRNTGTLRVVALRGPSGTRSLVCVSTGCHADGTCGVGALCERFLIDEV